MNYKTPCQSGHGQILEKSFTGIDHTIPKLVANIRGMLDDCPMEADRTKLRAALQALQPDQPVIAGQSEIAISCNEIPVQPDAKPPLLLIQPEITPKERQILGLIYDGYTNKQIAGILDRSQRTVDKHRSNLLDKFGVNKVTLLIQKAHALMMVGNFSVQT